MIFDFRNIGFIVLLALVVSFLGCKQNNIGDKLPFVDIKQTNKSLMLPILEFDTIGIDSINIVKRVFVTDRAGANLFSKPDTNSNINNHLPFMRELKVIDEHSSWYKVAYYVHRDIESLNYKYRYRWEIFYIKKEKTGVYKDLKLTEKDFYESYSEYDWKTHTKTYNSYYTQNVIQLELVSESEYLHVKQVSSDKLIRDTLSPEKTNYITNLKCDNGTLKLYDSPERNSSQIEYTYLGYYNFLDKFLFHVDVYEGSGHYRFYKKSDYSAQYVRLPDYPLFTPDGKYLISVQTDMFKNADLEVYKIEKIEFRLILRSTFENWTPDYQASAFMDISGNVYMPIFLKPNGYLMDGGIQDSKQYIKISIRE